VEHHQTEEQVAQLHLAVIYQELAEGAVAREVLEHHHIRQFWLPLVESFQLLDFAEMPAFPIHQVVALRLLAVVEVAAAGQAAAVVEALQHLAEGLVVRLARL
jgi:hypothetical protein